MDRRQFIQATAAGVAGSGLAGLSQAAALQSGEDMDRLYDQAVVIDSPAIENWYIPRLRIFKPSYNVRWPPWIPELDKPERFRRVARGLGRRGYRSGDIEKLLGRNWLDYFREVFGG